VLRRPLESAQYACGDYIDRLEQAGIQPSMSRAGCPYDNAMAESFMKTLKAEEVDAAQYRDLADARSAIASFIDHVYNRQRLHSALDYQPPEEFELTHRLVVGRPSDHEPTTTTVP
jgi:transposase InsO family protein